MITFKQLMERAGGGQSAGRFELHTTTPEQAVKVAEKMFAKHGHDLHEDIPNFEQNYLVAKSNATTGKLRRNEMPVIKSGDLQGMLAEFKARGVKVTKGKMRVADMKPLQYQIYVDKAMKWTAMNGPKENRRFLEKDTRFILSNDKYIMEGHHRFLQALLFDPNLKANYVMIDMNHDQLLKFLLTYTDKIGNIRNEEVNHGKA